MFGNRGGCLHTRDRRLRQSRWTSRRWITCILEFRGRHREVMAPNRYTELFFLDEATAFAAGHRPCMECRRSDAKRFIEAWSAVQLPAGHRLRSVDQIDDLAHGERIQPGTRRQATREALLSALPDGAMITLRGAPEQALLVWGRELYPWSFAGYGRPQPMPEDPSVTLLTPPSFVTAFAAGYTPSVHASVTSD